MARININEFSAQAGGVASRANYVRTDPAVVKAAQDAWADVKDARTSCAVLARHRRLLGRGTPATHLRRFPSDSRTPIASSGDGGPAFGKPGPVRPRRREQSAHWA